MRAGPQEGACRPQCPRGASLQVALGMYAPSRGLRPRLASPPRPAPPRPAPPRPPVQGEQRRVQRQARAPQGRPGLAQARGAAAHCAAAVRRQRPHARLGHQPADARRGGDRADAGGRQAGGAGAAACRVAGGGGGDDGRNRRGGAPYGGGGGGVPLAPQLRCAAPGPLFGLPLSSLSLRGGEGRGRGSDGGGTD